MENHNDLTPLCDACVVHKVLKDKVYKNMKNNTQEHNDILNSIDVIIGNIRWMNIIGKWVLATMLGYFVGIAVFIMTCDYATPKDIEKIETRMKEGEILHYQNEKVIENIVTRLEILIERGK